MSIEEAIKVLKSHGYIVKKITPRMEKDSKRCDELDSQGECMDCSCCSCSICIMQ
ncbi:MAG: hypothetical protein RR942_01230 [Romboutsia sp.]